MLGGAAEGTEEVPRERLPASGFLVAGVFSGGQRAGAVSVGCDAFSNMNLRKREFALAHSSVRDSGPWTEVLGH